MWNCKPKMHKIQFRLGLCRSAPDPAGGAYSDPPDRLAGFQDLLLRKGKGVGMGRKKGGERGRVRTREMERYGMGECEEM